jgi:hypothetical protein
MDVHEVDPGAGHSDLDFAFSRLGNGKVPPPLENFGTAVPFDGDGSHDFKLARKSCASPSMIGASIEKLLHPEFMSLIFLDSCLFGKEGP